MSDTYAEEEGYKDGACVSWVWHLQLSLHGLSSFLLQLEIRIWLNCRGPQPNLQLSPIGMTPHFRDGRERDEGWESKKDPRVYQDTIWSCVCQLMEAGGWGMSGCDCIQACVTVYSGTP